MKQKRGGKEREEEVENKKGGRWEINNRSGWEKGEEEEEKMSEGWERIDEEGI